ncbi:MAG: hypothetical protein QOK10_2124 [Pseudonocardiales bacterium]|jgi:NADH:ubiquinone oxidoreductase subunit F (NADH-binding)|nr:hypothetical protein [Pseudonocardiales bacterium]
MTAVRDPRTRPAELPLGWLAEPRLLAGVDAARLTDYRAHLVQHGPAPVPGREALLGQLDAVSLTGRGGAAFPLATKIRALRAGAGAEVVVNGCEGEPASAKDTALLTHAPHLVLDGAAIIAAAVGADRVLVAVTDRATAVGLEAAIGTRPDAPRFEVRLVAHRFIAGEARALVAALDGGTPLPPGRRIPPTERGVGGAPTLLSNAETFAQLAVLVRIGAARFGRVGTAAEPGTALLTVSGAVRRPGVVEVPIGSSLDSVATAVGAYPSQAVVIGGFHGAWLPPDPRIELSRAGLAAIGGSLGAGVVIFVGQQSCGLAELGRVAGWLADESAGQCGPCAFGLPALAAEVQAVAAGAPVTGTILRHAGMVRGRGACAHPDGAARFLNSGLAVLAQDVARHQVTGGCGRPDRGHLSTSRDSAMAGRAVSVGMAS